MKLSTIILAHLFLLMYCSQKEYAESKIEEYKEMIDDSFKQENEAIAERVKMIEKGSSMPQASILDLEMREISLESFYGQILVIDFWATWCSPCLTEIPYWKELTEKYPEVKFIRVSIDADRTNWLDYSIENDIDGFWIGENEDNPLFTFVYSEMKFNSSPRYIVSLPTYVIVSADGVILDNYVAPPNCRQVEMQLKELL